MMRDPIFAARPARWCSCFRSQVHWLLRPSDT